MANYWSKNPIEKSVFGDGATSVKLELWVESAHGLADYAMVLVYKLSPDTGDQCKFRIESVLDAILEEAKQAETMDLEAQFTQATGTIRNFYTVITWLGIDGETLSTTTSDPDTVILGSTSYISHPVSSFFSIPQQLHSRPSGITVRQGLLFLGYLGSLSTGNILRYRFEKTADGTERLVDLVYELSGAVGVWHILLNQWPADDEKVEFTAGIWNGEECIYGPFNFTLDREYSPIERTFLFRNHQSGWETLVATGIGQEKLEVDRQVANRILGANYQADKGNRFVYQSEGQIRMKVSSGWMPNQVQARWLSWQLIMSTEVYEILSGKRVPILINTKSIETFQDENYLVGLSFEYEYAFNALGFPI